MNSERGTDRWEIERQERIENKRIHEKTREKRNKDWKENQRGKMNGRNKGMHQHATFSLPLNKPTLWRLRIEA